MLEKIFAHQIEIKIGDKTLKFNSLADYEFSLAGRTSVPSKKIRRMLRFSLVDLKKEVRIIKNVEKRFVKIITKSIEEPDSINRALREIDLQFFSKDHGWRMIIAGLHDNNDALNPFRKVALTKYMQYLSSRQDIIKYLYLDKKKRPNPIPSTSVADESDAAFKETLILEDIDSDPLPIADKKLEMEKMPKGENVTIPIRAGKEIDILLSRHQCKLIGGESMVQFIDEKGHSYPLKYGKNTIGRDTKSDIIVDPCLRDISRFHVVVEVDEMNTVDMTDLSLHGTYLPAKYLASQSF